LKRFPEMAGRTDSAIVRDILELNGATADPGSLRDFHEVLSDVAVATCHRIPGCGRALPGAELALRALAQEGIPQSVVTGNIRAVAEVKLHAFHLTTYLDLDIGGYGSDGQDRLPLVRRAHERANRKHRIEFDRRRVFVIGDTPSDIRAARGAGVRSIGIATGASCLSDLRAFGPTAAFGDLSDIEAVLHVIVGAGGGKHPGSRL
jgi:phosphoglycolate phosphatase